MDDNTIPTRPLCVDLDGTLIQTDTLNYLIVAFLRAHVWRGWEVLAWWAQGRAHLKKRLGEEVVLRIDHLPEHPEFVRFLEAQHAAGRTLILASASDARIVQKVADRFKFFSGILGSDGKTNLRGAAKLKKMTELYGPRGFDYAGNSSVDIPVWAGSAEAIVVNARPNVEQRAREVATVARVFPPLLSRWELWKKIWRG